MKPPIVFCVFALLVVALAGCQTARPKSEVRKQAPSFTATNFATESLSRQVDSQWLLPPTNLFTLGPGDRLEIEVMGDPATRASTIVGPDGKIYFYLLPGLKVWGLTLAEVKALLERELAKYFQESPRVAVTLRAVQSKRVWLLGRLNSPGVYSLTAPMTLLEAISLAGGPATSGAVTAVAGGATMTSLPATVREVADLQRSFVIRQGQLLPVDFQRLLREGDVSQNIYLQPDDFVYLPSEAGRDIHVLGAVGQPRGLNFTEQLTLVSAVARAGGTVKDAYLSHVAIVRGSLTQPKIAVVDYRAIVRGQAPDVRLEPHDIVYVPFAPYRTVTRYLDLIVNTFVRTVGANEGARAVSGGALPVGVNVPLGF